MRKQEDTHTLEGEVLQNLQVVEQCKRLLKNSHLKLLE